MPKDSKPRLGAGILRKRELQQCFKDIETQGLLGLRRSEELNRPESSRLWEPDW